MTTTKTLTKLVAAIACTTLISSAAYARDTRDPKISSTPPASGITFVEDVVIQEIKPNLLQFEATSSSRFKMNDVLAVLYCRVAGYKDEKSYAAWDVEAIQRVSSGRPGSSQIVTASINFYNDPIPADAKPMTKDWCPDIPDAANPNAKSNQYVDPNSIGTAPAPSAEGQ